MCAAAQDSVPNAAALPASGSIRVHSGRLSRLERCHRAVHTKKGTASWPQYNEEAVIKEFGEEKEKILVDQIHSLVQEMYEIKVDWEKHTDITAADFVLDEIKKRYPRLSEEALRALWWKFTFDMK